MADKHFGKKGKPEKRAEYKEDVEGAPKTGFSSAGSNEQNLFEPCKGIGGSNPGAH